MKPPANPAFFIISAIIVALGAYWFFFTDSGNDVPLVTEGGDVTSAETEFKLLVSELSSIKFNKEIFSDPRFMALVDLSTQVTPESSGRLDPFAPISGIKSEQ